MREGYWPCSSRKTNCVCYKAQVRAGVRRERRRGLGVAQLVAASALRSNYFAKDDRAYGKSRRSGKLVKIELKTK